MLVKDIRNARLRERVEGVFVQQDMDCVWLVPRGKQRWAHAFIFIDAGAARRFTNSVIYRVLRGGSDSVLREQLYDAEHKERVVGSKHGDIQSHFYSGDYEPAACD